MNWILSICLSLVLWMKTKLWHVWPTPLLPKRHWSTRRKWPKWRVKKQKRSVCLWLVIRLPWVGLHLWRRQHVYCRLSPPVPYTRLCPVPLRWALRRHLYLGNLALHLCPLDLPGSFVIGVGLLQLASPRLLLLQLLPKLLQQRPQGLQHLSVLPELHGRNSDIFSLYSTLRHTCTSSSSPFLISMFFIWVCPLKHSNRNLLCKCFINQFVLNSFILFPICLLVLCFKHLVLSHLSSHDSSHWRTQVRTHGWCKYKVALTNWSNEITGNLLGTSEQCIKWHTYIHTYWLI